MTYETSIEGVLDALARVLDTTNEHDRAFERHAQEGGYSWDYHGAGYIIARDEARSDFAKRLDGYIDARIDVKLNEPR